ncbi:MAG TPA: FKBP-type peptidyl-prolyl cis-trans isomerase [Candidatus Dojkabacteria bacterium]|nr:FKBP-type peptidyl-prolyl cis-trans isomerase [Candidatus Dojkabacteria bacterium]HQF36515.1 FKBP-type peptidyl-prolyl cis-trans isomerase [Candidatus Dojkabacteria bacterium]
MKTKHLLIIFGIFIIVITVLFLLPPPKDNTPQISITEITAGEGEQVTEETTVLFHYSAKFDDGSEFENTNDTGEPMETIVKETYPEGLKQGLVGMKVGEKREIYVPYQLAYGVMGGYPYIPPRANITYTVELLEIIVPIELQTEDIIVGEGAEITIGDTLIVNMIEKLQDDTIITNTYETDTPIELSTNDEIEGLKEGLKGMKVGGKRKITIPYQDAFGATGSTPTIPARSNMIYEIEVLEIAEPKGISYEITKEGTGKQVNKTDKVSVHYTGTLLDGTKFDSSVDRGTPFEFTLNNSEVIKGWDLGVEGMKVGEKRTVTIPYYLAYGATGRSPTIPPRAKLVFELELIEIK